MDRASGNSQAVTTAAARRAVMRRGSATYVSRFAARRLRFRAGEALPADDRALHRGRFRTQSIAVSLPICSHIYPPRKFGPSGGGEKEDGWPRDGREPDPSSLAEAHLDNKCTGGHDDHGDISCGLEISLRRA